MDANGEEEEESEPEGGAVNLMGDNTGDEDSSEEEDEGSDAEREVRKGRSRTVLSHYGLRRRGLAMGTVVASSRRCCDSIGGKGHDID